jgi:hypothetical protein
MNKEYWFARGYYDGRSKGSVDESVWEIVSGEFLQSYKIGYDAGVTDYCVFDIVEVE